MTVTVKPYSENTLPGGEHNGEPSMRLTVVDPQTEAAIVNYHGDNERADGETYQAPRATRREVEAELHFDLLTAAMQGAI